MDKKIELQKLINKIAEDSVKAKALAIQVYGKEAMVFAQADGDLHVMSGDCDGPARLRQEFIEMSSDTNHELDIGAW